ncbi:MAG: hypothetical protein ACR2M1_08415 [Gemmatimonadaceae bacterium]
MTDPGRNRTLRWRDADDRARLNAVSEADVIRVMRERSHYANVDDDTAYMCAVAARFLELDGTTVRSDSAASFVEDIVAVGQVEAVWVDQEGRETRIPPDAYRLARLRASGLPILDPDDPKQGVPHATNGNGDVSASVKGDINGGAA